VCLAIALAMLSIATALAAEPRVFDIVSEGAIADGKTVNTKSIQSAIDRCTAAGGGTVRVPAGRFVTGTLYLKSKVTLRLEADAVLLGSPNIADYSTDTDRTMYRGEPYMDRCLIFAKDATDVGIEGPGAIDGQGKSFPNKGDRQRNRPKLLRVLNCTQLRMRDVHLEAPASWTSEWRYCDDIDVHGVSIHSRANSNGDGLDFDGCTNVRVSDSTFDTSDDSICLQTSSPQRPCRNVVVSGCHFSSRWAGVRIGLLSRGDFEDVHVSDCVFDNHKDSGIKIQMNEGGEMRDLTFSDLKMKDVPRPVFVTFCQKNAWVDAGDDMPPMKRVSGLTFERITVETTNAGKGSGFIVTGMPGHPVEDVTFSNITATFPGGGTEQDAKNVLAELTPDNLVNHWPEYSSFRANVPAFGVYARHVKGLKLKNITINTTAADARPPVIVDDVTGVETDGCPTPVVR
jgi:polygalacturonase